VSVEEDVEEMPKFKGGLIRSPFCLTFECSLCSSLCEIKVWRDLMLASRFLIREELSVDEPLEHPIESGGFFMLLAQYAVQ